MVKVAGTQWCAQYPLRSPITYYIDISEFLFVPRCVDRNISVDSAPRARLVFDERSFLTRKLTRRLLTVHKAVWAISRVKKVVALKERDVHLYPNLRTVTCVLRPLRTSTRRLCKCSGCYWPPIAYYVDDDTRPMIVLFSAVSNDFSRAVLRAHLVASRGFPLPSIPEFY